MIANTVGIIDSDYYGNADNDGHIFIKIYQFTIKTWIADNDQIKLGSPSDATLFNDVTAINAGTAIAQGIIESYYTCEEEEVTAERTGGIGSTDSNQKDIKELITIATTTYDPNPDINMKILNSKS